MTSTIDAAAAALAGLLAERVTAETREFASRGMGPVDVPTLPALAPAREASTSVPPPPSGGTRRRASAAPRLARESGISL
jgi:hypothetical protein